MTAPHGCRTWKRTGPKGKGAAVTLGCMVKKSAVGWHLTVGMRASDLCPAVCPRAAQWPPNWKSNHHLKTAVGWPAGKPTHRRDMSLPSSAACLQPRHTVLVHEGGRRTCAEQTMGDAGRCERWAFTQPCVIRRQMAARPVAPVHEDVGDLRCQGFSAGSTTEGKFKHHGEAQPPGTGSNPGGRQERQIPCIPATHQPPQRLDCVKV